MEKSLVRARDSESKLKNELENISKVYHLAEFGKLSSGAFHDLINPLTSISLYIDELSEKQTNKNFTKVTAACNRMQNFIEAIEKQVKPHKAIGPIEINKEIEQVIELLSFKARRSKCEVIFEEKENFVVYGDALSFYQITTNLLSNAIDACESLDKNKLVAIGIQKEKEAIKIIIKDNGIGIPKENLHKIFEPFFTTKSFKKGMGLGLFTSKEKVEKEFGGRIDVNSDLNGTEFIISLPRKTHK